MTYIVDPRVLLSDAVAQSEEVIGIRNLSNFVIDVNRGKITDFSYDHVVGRCGDLGTQFEQVRPNCGTSYTWMTTASILDITSSSNQDRAAGTGAHKIRVVGLDTNWDKIVEDVTLNGVTTVQTTNSFIRILRAFVIESGAYQGIGAGTNVGDITFDSQTQGEQAFLSAGKGKTTSSQWAIPRGFEGYLTRVAVQAPGTRPVDFNLFVRNNANDVTSPYGGARVVTSYDEIGDRYEEVLLSYRKFAQYSDVWAEARTSQGTSIVNTTFDIITVPIV